MGYMKALTTGLLLLATLVTTLPAEAQVRGRRPPPQASDTINGMLLTGHGLMYLRFDQFFHPPSQSRWVMADAAVGGGAALHMKVGDGVWLGAEATMANTNYERRPRQGGAPLAEGRATISTALLSGRIGGSELGRLGGLGALGYLGRAGYFNLGIGAINYRLEDLEDSTTDFLISTAGGLEHAWPSGRAIYFEMRRFWVFHEREGVESATANHSRSDLGLRIPLRR